MSKNAKFNLDWSVVNSPTDIDALPFQIGFALVAFEIVGPIYYETLQSRLKDTPWRVIFFSNESHLAELVMDKPPHLLFISDYWGHDYSKKGGPRRYVNELLNAIIDRRMRIGADSVPFIALVREMTCPEPDRYKRNIHFDIEVDDFYATSLTDFIRRTLYKLLTWKRWEKTEPTGSPDAMTKLGMMYESADGDLRDYDCARWWYEKAANAGNTDAMRKAAHRYEAIQDYKQARNWYKKAADAGDADAVKKLKQLASALWVAQDLSEALLGEGKKYQDVLEQIGINLKAATTEFEWLPHRQGSDFGRYVKAEIQRILRFVQRFQKNSTSHSPVTQWYLDVKEEVADSGLRLLLSTVGQGHLKKAHTVLHNLLRKLNLEEKLRFTVDFLTQVEGGFDPKDSRLGESYTVVWKVFHNAALSSVSPQQRNNDLQYFAGRMLAEGFLDVSESAYTYLVQQFNEFSFDREAQISILTNLGAVSRDRRKFSDARTAFERARVLAENDPRVDRHLACAIAGVADCDLFELADLSRAKKHYQLALQLGNKTSDIHAQFWAYLGLGDVLLSEHEYGEAEKNYRDLPRIPQSAGGQSRHLLGLTRACLRQGKLLDAEFFVDRGLVTCLRQAYWYRREMMKQEKQAISNSKNPSLSAGTS